MANGNRPSLDEIFGVVPPQVEEPGLGETALHQGIQGLTMGFADEMGAGLNTAISQLKGSDESFKDEYTRRRDSLRERDQRETEANPVTAAVANIAGSLPTLLESGAMQGVNALTRIGKSALAGGVHGLGNSEADLTEGEVGRASLDTIFGMGVGGAGGAVGEAMVPAAKALGRGASKLSDYAYLKATGADLSDLRALKHQGKLATFADDVRNSGAVRFGDSAEDVAKRAEALKQQHGERVGSSLQEIDAAKPSFDAIDANLADEQAQNVAKGLGLPEKFSIVSTQQGSVPNPEAHQALKRELDRMGYRYKEVRGQYGSSEPSFIIAHDGSAEEKGIVEWFGRKYNQESVLHSDALENELKFLNGSPSLKSRGINDAAKAKDFYTELPDGGKFQLNIEPKPASQDMWVNGNKIADRIERELVQPLAGSQANQRFAAAMQREADIWRASGDSPIPFEKLNAEKSKYYNLVNWDREQSLPKELLKDVGRILNEEVETAAQGVARKMGDSPVANEFMQAKKSYGVAKDIAEFAGDRALRQRSNMPVGLADLAWGGVIGMGSGGMGAIPGAVASKVIRSRGASSAAVVLDKLAAILKQAPEALQKFRQPLEVAAQRGDKSLAAAHYVLSKSNPNYREVIKKVVGE